MAYDSMEYKLEYDEHMKRKFPRAYAFADFIGSMEDYEAMAKLQNECVTWLASMLHINYTYELHTRITNPNGDPMPIEFIMFRYEADLLAFRLRFGF